MARMSGLFQRGAVLGRLEPAMVMVRESPFASDPMPFLREGRGSLRMEPKLRLTDPVHRDDPILVPGKRDAAPVRRWQPRLTKQSDDPVIRGVEDTLKQMESEVEGTGTDGG